MSPALITKTKQNQSKNASNKKENYQKNLKRYITLVLFASGLVFNYTGNIVMFFYVCLGLVVLASFIVFVVIPLVFLWFPSIMRNFIFLPHSSVPCNNEYKNPGYYGFVGGRNFYLTTKDDATLGVWHLLPTNLEDEAKKQLTSSQADDASRESLYDKWLADATVFLYLHGSAGTRTSEHRLRTYHLLNQLGYHVVTFDYRGYGDSNSTAFSETDLTVDTMEVMSWIEKRVKTGNIFMWGHSLGTGVVAGVADFALSSKDKPKIQGLVLEAPFDNMASAVRASPLVEMVSFLPWFEYCFIQPLYKSGLDFSSDLHLKNISTPILILHAKDDQVVPYSYGEKLYKGVSEFRKDPSTVEMISYNSSLGYGHYDITLDPSICNVTKEFVETSTR